MSFRILDLLIGITSKILLVALKKYSRSSKFLCKEQDFIWNKESEFASNFIFWISLISRFLKSMKFSGLFLLYSAVNSLSLLINNLRFGDGLGDTNCCYLHIFSQRIHSFHSCSGNVKQQCLMQSLPIPDSHDRHVFELLKTHY